MKIFRIFPNIKSSGKDNLSITLRVLPDTALLIQKRPFFIPDFTNDCQVQLCYVVRINRLGRSIHAKFAHRYYDMQALTLGAHFIAADLFEILKKEGKPCDIAVGFDNAVAVSEVHYEKLLQSSAIAITIASSVNSYVVNREIPKMIDSIIAYISSFYTLKQGDLLLIPVSSEKYGVAIDNHISLTADDQELLSFNVK